MTNLYVAVNDPSPEEDSEDTILHESGKWLSRRQIIRKAGTDELYLKQPLRSPYFLGSIGKIGKINALNPSEYQVVFDLNEQAYKHST